MVRVGVEGRLFPAQIISAIVAIPLLVAAASAQRVLVGSVTGQQGSQSLPLAVSLENDGMAVSAVDVTLAFDGSNAWIAANSQGRPACTVNPDINKPDTKFNFVWTRCFGKRCRGIHARVRSLRDKTAIANGSTLFTCAVDVALAAPTGNCPVLVTRVRGKTPDHQRLRGMIGADGDVLVVPSVVLNSASGPPGSRLAVSATLTKTGGAVLGLQHEASFDAVNTPIAATPSGNPDCRVNPSLDKTGAFAFRPIGCSGSACTGIRALVFSMADSDPLPDGAVLYTCIVSVAATATAGAYPVRSTQIVAATRNNALFGPLLSLAGVAVDGAIVVTQPGN